MGSVGMLRAGRWLHVPLTTSKLPESLMALTCRELQPELDPAHCGTGRFCSHSTHILSSQGKGLQLEPMSRTPKATPLSSPSASSGFDRMALRAHGLLHETEEYMVKALYCGEVQLIRTRKQFGGAMDNSKGEPSPSSAQ